jgi:hypothetical protein
LANIAEGGSFQSGFLAAGFGAAATPYTNTGNFFGNVAAEAVAGGVGSVLGGGKFENGAETAAFGYMYNTLGGKIAGAIVGGAVDAACDVASEGLCVAADPEIEGGAIKAGDVASNTALARALGREGEAAVRAVYDIGDKLLINVNGAGRVPDGLTKTVLSEVKNVANQSFTRQLRDYAGYALDTGRTFNLYLRPGTGVSGPLQDAFDKGLINRMDIP